MNPRHLVPALALSLAACASETPQDKARNQVTETIKGELSSLVQAVRDLQSAAPAGPWGAGEAAAIETMKDAWKRTRVPYERMEGAIAVLFSDIDNTIDNRYTAFLDENGPDTNLFDGDNVTGMHAVERILWSDKIPQAVIDFESQRQGYVAARFPQTQQEATDFKTGLCQKMLDDALTMQNEFATAVVLDNAAAFRGVIGSMAEQREKVRLASTSEEESRYSRHTLGDMRANLEGAQNTLNAFKTWITDSNGAELMTKIQARLDAVKTKYASIQGDSIPDVPANFDPELPTAADLATPYGQLFQLLEMESNPDEAGSAVALMTEAADLLKIPQLAE